jgi:hypothetical protein
MFEVVAAGLVLSMHGLKLSLKPKQPVCDCVGTYSSESDLDSMLGRGLIRAKFHKLHKGTSAPLKNQFIHAGLDTTRHPENSAQSCLGKTITCSVTTKIQEWVAAWGVCFTNFRWTSIVEHHYTHHNREQPPSLASQTIA